MGKKGTEQFAPRPRKRLLVDPKLQGALLAHTTLYWSYCLLSVGVIAVAWIVLAKQPSTSTDLFQDLWQNFGPALIGAFLLLPLVLLDCLRLSNRFAGPMVRIQRCMKQLADGEEARPIKLRDGDFWCDFVDNLNRVIERTTSASRVEGSHESPSSDTCGPMVTAEAKLNAVPTSPVIPPLDSGSVTAANIYADV